MAKSKSEAGFDEELYDKLHEAVVKGNTTKVQSLLQKFTKDEARDVLNRNCPHNFVPLLIVAIRNRHENLVQLLVDYYDVRVDQADLQPPEDIDNSAIGEWTPVLEGVAVRNPVTLDILCKKAENIDIGYPVHQACKGTTQGGTDILNVLLRHGAQINIRDTMGMTPLIVACQYRNYFLVNFLLQNGADVNICSLDGNTPLHHLIERNDECHDCKKHIQKKKKKSPDNRSVPLQLELKPESDCDHRKSAERTILKISKELLEHGMRQNPNEKGLTPLYLACLKGSESVVEFLLDNLSVTDRERANCYELLASSILLKNGLNFTHRCKNGLNVTRLCKINLDKPYYFLTKAMVIRHSHDPPLSKCRKQVNLETDLHQLETQTLQELQTIKTNVNGLITDLLFARKRILTVGLYNDYLLPFLGDLIEYELNKHLFDNAHGSRDNHVVVLLLNAFRLQRQSSVNPSSDTLKERIKWLDKVCEHVEMLGTVNISVFGAILDSIEEFYECRNSEKAYMTKDTYVLLLNFLHCIVTTVFLRNDECRDIKALTKKYLRLTKSSMELNLHPSTSVLNKISPYGSYGMCKRNIPPKLVTGDNVLHIASREIKGTSYYRDMLEISNNAREGLAKLLKTLHGCGEDVNAQNSDGHTPLHVLVSDHRVVRYRDGDYSLKYFDFPAAVRSLLLAGANPDVRDKSQSTSLHAALIGYAHFFRSVWSSKCDLKELNSTVEILLKSGANPQARDSQGFSPLHVLMDAFFPDGKGYDLLLVRSINIQSPDQFAHNRKMFHELVRTIRSYGGCAHATIKDGRSVFDMCKDDELIEKMSQDIRVTRVHLTLFRLAAAAIRKHQVQYDDKLLKRLTIII